MSFFITSNDRIFALVQQLNDDPTHSQHINDSMPFLVLLAGFGLLCILQA